MTNKEELQDWMDEVQEKQSISDATLELKRLKHKLSLSNKKIEELVERLNLAEERESFLLELKDYNPEPIIIKPLDKLVKHEATAVALASDWHVEELVEPSTINGMNTYNTTIARQRSVEFFRGILWMIRNSRTGATDEYGFSIKNLVLWLGGDLISGYIHEELMESNELSPTEATLFAQDLIVSGIDFLLKHGELEKIIIPCSYGNHGRCHDEQTELLTFDGWKKYDELTKGQLVATYNMETHQNEWQPLLDVYIADYTGPMVSVKTRTADFQVTPHHRMVVNNYRTNKSSIMLMEDLLGKKLDDKRFPKCTRGHSNECTDVSDDEIRLAAWLLTDGCYTHSNSGLSISIYQSKETGIKKISNLLNTLDLKYSLHVRERDPSKIQIKGVQVKTARPEHTFYLFKESHDKVLSIVPDKKKLPAWCWKLSQRQFDIFIESLMDGDGSSFDGFSNKALYGKKEFLEQVQALCIINGIGARLREDSRGDFVLSLPQSIHHYINEPEKQMSPVQYDGKIWCGTVENGTLITRRNGIPLVSGNSTIKKRHSTGAKNSYEWMMYQQLRRLYENEPRVEFVIADGAHVYLGIYDWTLRFHHGDDVKYGGGVGGLTVPLRKAVDSWNIGRYADITCIGHYHQFFDCNFAIVNGSLVGYGPFSLAIKARYEPPMQGFFLIDRDRGKRMVSPIMVDPIQRKMLAGRTLGLGV